MWACFCSVNFRLLMFYWVNKLVRSYLLHIFIWLYILPVSAEGEWRQLRPETGEVLDVRPCSDPLARTMNITSCILSGGKFVMCRGRPGACLLMSSLVPQEHSPSEQLLAVMIPSGLIRALQQEDQVNVPKGRKPLEAQHERNAVPHLITLNKTHL